MELIYLLFVFCIRCALICSAPQGIKNFPFPFPPPVKDLPSYESATPYFTFDGVDYDDLPPRLKSKHYDCYGEHLRCVENRNYFHVVCSYNSARTVMGQYYSHCELEFQSCMKRGDKNMFGNKYYDDTVFFAGEGLYCWQSDKRDEVK